MHTVHDQNQKVHGGIDCRVAEQYSTTLMVGMAGNEARSAFYKLHDAVHKGLQTGSLFHRPLVTLLNQLYPQGKNLIQVSSGERQLFQRVGTHHYARPMNVLLCVSNPPPHKLHDSISRVVIGESLSEPHTTELDGGFFLYIYIYILSYMRL